MNKYKAKGQHTEEGWFDSKGELERWIELKWLQKAHQIKDLKRQVTFKLTVNGVLIGKYKIDYLYTEMGATLSTAEEFKGYWTPEAKLKARLFKALYPEYRFKVSGTPLDG